MNIQNETSKLKSFILESNQNKVKNEIDNYG